MITLYIYRGILSPKMTTSIVYYIILLLSVNKGIYFNQLLVKSYIRTFKVVGLI